MITAASLTHESISSPEFLSTPHRTPIFSYEEESAPNAAYLYATPNHLTMDTSGMSDADFGITPSLKTPQVGQTAPTLCAAREELRYYIKMTMACHLLGLSAIWDGETLTHLAVCASGAVTIIPMAAIAADSTALKGMKKLCTSPTVHKCVWDGRRLAAALERIIGVRMATVLDIPVILTADASHIDIHVGRRQRGVIRLPSMQDYIPPFADPVDCASCQAHTLLLYGAMCAQSGRVGLSVSLCDAFLATGSKNILPFVPLGISRPAEVDTSDSGVLCEGCGNKFIESAFPNTPRVKPVLCRVCWEPHLPCSDLGTGCTDPMCPYQHKAIPCTYGALCLHNRLLGCCPYEHPPTSTSTQCTPCTPGAVTYPPLYPKNDSRIPCRNFFQKGACALGAECPYSHVPVPVFIPVPVPTPCEPRHVKHFTPCLKYSRKGRCNNGANCGYLHIPPEFTQNNPIPWGALPMSA